MTSMGTEDLAVQALRCGAASYVPKRSLSEELIETLQPVLEVSQRQRSQTRLMECLTQNDCRFELENDRALIAPLVGYLQDGLLRLGICDESDSMRIGIALDEALVNALYHGNLEIGSELREEDGAAYHALTEQRCSQSPYRDRRIHVLARMSPQVAEFSIRDEGPGFDPSRLPDPTDPTNLEKVSGRGILLMRTFMDEVRFNEQGNCVQLVKRRSACSGWKAPPAAKD